MFSLRFGGLGLFGKRRRNIQWLLRDEFTTDRAAGAVEGTAAEPGPGMRTVVDGNSKISIASGGLAFATGGTVGDGLVFSTLTRTPGIVVMAVMSESNTTGPSLGWTALALPNAITERVGVTQNGISVNVAAAVVGLYISPALTADYKYTVAILQRSAGMDVFAKGDIFTNWAFLYRYTGSVTGITPGIQERATNVVGTVDWLRVAQLNWLPAPATSDGFGSAFGTSDGLGHAETTGIGSGGSGKTWTGATWATAAGAAYNTPTLGSELATGALVVGTWYSITASEVNYFYTGSAIGNTFRATATTALDANNKVKAITLATIPASTTHSTADVMATATPTLTAGTQAGVVVNLDSAGTPANFVIAYHDGTNCKLEKCVAGTYTSVISAAATYSAGAELRVWKSGTAYRLYYNNALVGSGTISDAGIISNTLHGLFSTYASNTFNTFVVYPTGTNGEHDALLNEIAAG